MRASLLVRVQPDDKEALVTHARAKLTVPGLVLLVEQVLQGGWSVPMAAEAQGCSPANGYKWVRRFLAEGLEGLADRSSRPHHSPMPPSPVNDAGSTFASGCLGNRYGPWERPRRVGSVRGVPQPGAELVRPGSHIEEFG